MRNHFSYNSKGEKLFCTVNAMAFGTVGDGLTDDIAAFYFLKNSGIKAYNNMVNGAFAE